MSSGPNATVWPHLISDEDISNLFEVNGEYGRFMASRFDALYLTPRESLFRDGGDKGIVLSSGLLAYNILMVAEENAKSVHWKDDASSGSAGDWDQFHMTDERMGSYIRSARIWSRLLLGSASGLIYGFESLDIVSNLTLIMFGRTTKNLSWLRRIAQLSVSLYLNVPLLQPWRGLIYDRITIFLQSE